MQIALSSHCQLTTHCLLNIIEYIEPSLRR